MDGRLAGMDRRAPVAVVHAGRCPGDHAARVDHEACSAKLADAGVHFFYEGEAGPGARAGRVDLTDVSVAPGTRAYLCGPLPFMRAVRGQRIDKCVVPADIHCEVFGPDCWQAQS